MSQRQASDRAPDATVDPEDIELELFVQGLHLRHGYDFTGYSRASLKRRVQALMHDLGHGHIGALTTQMLREESLLPRLIAGLSVPVSDLFRDPDVFRVLRQDVCPRLASWPRINIWQAGCAHGEETYSLAILLEEAGLYDRAHIYATDFSDVALARAQEGIFAVRDARRFSENYLAAGGTRSFSDYCHARYGHIKLDDRLKRHITFANHNLAVDGVFCEAHLVLCRNVLIYFSNTLQDRVLGLFRDTLVRGGMLCLGSKESLDFAPNGQAFTALDRAARLYQVKPRGP